jgi:glycosyltransferase involved in cell wall biosynthesis
LKPSISIVVAIYNRKDELFELLTSLTQQTDTEFEIIIVDDGSSIDLKPTISNFEESLDIKYFKKIIPGQGLQEIMEQQERQTNGWFL